MNLPHTLQSVSKFFNLLGAYRALPIICLADHFGGVYISDLAEILEVSLENMVNICVKLERAGIIQKKSVTRRKGRMVMVYVDKDARTIVSPFLRDLKNDPMIKDVINKFQSKKDAKELISDRYGI